MTRLQGLGSIEPLCAAAGVSRASYYRRALRRAPKAGEMALRDLVQRLSLAHRRYGARRITALVRREGWPVNHKRIERIRKADNLLCVPKKAFRPATTASRHAWPIWPNLAGELAPTGPDQLWVADITYVGSPRPSSIWRSFSTPSAARWSDGPWTTTSGPNWR